MYLWKCWNDTRSTFLALVGAWLAVGAWGAYVHFDPFGWIAAKPDAAQVNWRMSGGMVAMLIGLTPLTGFVLGALGVGTEFEKRTAEFLLTRPRARRRLLWTSWSLGAAQMIALVALSLAVNWLARSASGFGARQVSARMFAGMSVLALVIYSVTYLMTTLARNSRHGTGLALAAFTGYSGLYLWLRFWYQIVIPFIREDMFRAGRADAALPLLGWMTVCLALMLVAQFRLDRAEV